MPRMQRLRQDQDLPNVVVSTITPVVNILICLLLYGYNILFNLVYFIKSWNITVFLWLNGKTWMIPIHIRFHIIYWRQDGKAVKDLNNWYPVSVIISIKAGLLAACLSKIYKCVVERYTGKEAKVGTCYSKYD